MIQERLPWGSKQPNSSGVYSKSQMASHRANYGKDWGRAPAIAALGSAGAWTGREEVGDTPLTPLRGRSFFRTWARRAAPIPGSLCSLAKHYRAGTHRPPDSCYFGKLVLAPSCLKLRTFLEGVQGGLGHPTVQMGERGARAGREQAAGLLFASPLGPPSRDVTTISARGIQRRGPGWHLRPRSLEEVKGTGADRVRPGWLD